jgi:hypothetical protein
MSNRLLGKGKVWIITGTGGKCRCEAIKRLGEPKDITGAALFLTSDDAAFITGQLLSSTAVSIVSVRCLENRAEAGSTLHTPRPRTR